MVLEVTAILCRRDPPQSDHLSLSSKGCYGFLGWRTTGACCCGSSSTRGFVWVDPSVPFFRCLVFLLFSMSHYSEWLYFRTPPFTLPTSPGETSLNHFYGSVPFSGMEHGDTILKPYPLLHGDPACFLVSLSELLLIGTNCELYILSIMQLGSFV